MENMHNEWKGAKTLCPETVITLLRQSIQNQGSFFLIDSGSKYLGKRIFWNTKYVL